MLPLRDRNPTRHVPVATLALMVVTVAVFFFVQPRSGVDRVYLDESPATRLDATIRFSYEYAAVPCELTQNRPLDLREVTDALRGNEACRDVGPFFAPVFPSKHVWLAGVASIFLHGGYLHIGSNMLFLWIFGNNIEDHMGPLRYLVFYLLAGVVALAAHVAAQPDSTVPILGASGAVAGVMGAYAVWFPRAPITTLFLIVVRDISAIWLLGIWFVTQFFTGTDSSVAWIAHVGGFVFGALFGLLVRSVPAVRRRVWRDPWRSAAGPWSTTGAGIR